MQIRIYLDGTFESLSAAKTITPAEKRARIKELQADLKIIKKVEALRHARTDAKRMANKVKDKALLAQIKALKAKLSSNRNSSSEKVMGFIKAVMDQATGTGKTIAQLDKSKKSAPAQPARSAKSLKALNDHKARLDKAPDAQHVADALLNSNIKGEAKKALTKYGKMKEPSAIVKGANSETSPKNIEMAGRAAAARLTLGQLHVMGKMHKTMVAAENRAWKKPEAEREAAFTAAKEKLLAGINRTKILGEKLKDADTAKSFADGMRSSLSIISEQHEVRRASKGHGFDRFNR